MLHSIWKQIILMRTLSLKHINWIVKVPILLLEWMNFVNKVFIDTLELSKLWETIISTV